MTFITYKLIETDDGKRYISNCNDDSETISKIRSIYGGCPTILEEHFDIENSIDIAKNLKICKKNSDELFVIPLNAAYDGDFPEEYSAGRIVKVTDIKYPESVASYHDEAYDIIYNDLQCRAGQYIINIMELNRLQRELGEKGLLDVANHGLMLSLKAKNE